MEIKRYKEDKNVKKDISRLLVSAFPRNERPPVNMFFDNVDKRKENELFAYYDNSNYIGFTFLTFYKDIVYIFFLAVEEKQRNKGYGHKIINSIKETYPDKVLLLCYEEVDPKYIDFELRIKRRNFYLSLGFNDNGYKTNEFGVVFHTAYLGKHKVPFEDYKNIFALGFGNFAKSFISKE